jgi:hypothetical protein
MKRIICLFTCFCLLSIIFSGCVEEEPYDGSILKPSEIKQNYEKYKGLNVTVRAVFFWGAITIIDKEELFAEGEKNMTELLLNCRFHESFNETAILEEIRATQPEYNEYILSGWIEKGERGPPGRIVITEMEKIEV